MKYQCDNFAESNNHKKVPFSSLVRRIQKKLSLCCVFFTYCLFFLSLMTFNLAEPSQAQTEAVDHTRLPWRILVKAKFPRCSGGVVVAALPRRRRFHFLSEFVRGGFTSGGRGVSSRWLHIYWQITWCLGVSTRGEGGGGIQGMCHGRRHETGWSVCRRCAGFFFFFS